jgi:hypothetical protein
MGNGIRDKKKELAKAIATRMSDTAQIDALRSTKGQLKGMVSKDSMYRLRQALDDHRSPRTTRAPVTAWPSSWVSATATSTGTVESPTPGRKRR